MTNALVVSLEGVWPSLGGGGGGVRSIPHVFLPLLHVAHDQLVATHTILHVVVAATQGHTQPVQVPPHILPGVPQKE